MSRKTVRVFEHDRLVCGQRLRTADGETVVFQPSHFESLVRFNDDHEQRFFTVGHRSVRFQSFVGYLQIGDLGIEILPKVDRSSVADGDRARWHNALLEMLRVSGRLRLHAPSTAHLSLRHASLLEVFIERFLAEVELLLRHGLTKSYRTVEENRNAFRGRLLVTENIRENLVHAERFFVAHEVYDHETLPNRILATALDVIRQISLPTQLTSKAAELRLAMPEIRVGGVREADFRRLQLSRKTERYREAIELARLLILQFSPRLQAGEESLLALLFDMNVLWERYVAALFRNALPVDVELSTQDSHPFWRAGRARRRIRPDVVVRDAITKSTLVIIDTKWKVPRDGHPSDPDLKQMFAYNEVYSAPRSILLYPAESDQPSGPLFGDYAVGGHQCGVVFLNLFHEGSLSRATATEQLRAIVSRARAEVVQSSTPAAATHP